MVLEVLARQVKQTKRTQIGKEDVKTSLSAYGMTLYIKDHNTPPKHSTTDFHKTFTASKAYGCKIYFIFVSK